MDDSPRVATADERPAVTRAIFDVSDVPADTSQLPTCSAAASWNGLLMPLEARRSHGDVASSLEACANPERQLVSSGSLHAVVAAIHAAFDQHRPLCLSPDIVWLMIAQGFSAHVTANAEPLRRRFVAHDGQLLVEVDRPELRKGSPHNDWSSVVDELCAKVAEHIGQETSDLLLPSFSTTTPVDRAAAQIALLEALREYFSYGVNTLCGIPRVILEGTVADWEAIASRAAGLAAFDLAWWTDPLSLILEEFVAAARGRARASFWQSIYKHQSASGGPLVTGWIAAFFPYVLDGQRRLVRNARLPSAGEGREGAWSALRMSAFPSGLARAPFRWKYLNEKFAMEFIGGFAGVSQTADTSALRPEIGWAIDDAGRRPVLNEMARRHAAADAAAAAERASERARAWVFKAMCPVCGRWEYGYEDRAPSRCCETSRVNLEYRGPRNA